MKNAIILHGMPSRAEYEDPNSLPQSGKHWLGWLKHELEERSIATNVPDLPRPYAPVYQDWCAAFPGHLITKDTLLIGHSCGAGFLVRWLSEHSMSSASIALVAPFLDPDRDEVPGNFFDFAIDPALSTRMNRLGIFVSDDDDPEILTSTNLIHSALPNADMLHFSGRGHFVARDNETLPFPELLDWLLA